MAFPDYYAILGVDERATPDQIKTAYKRKSLISHPDRVPHGPNTAEQRKAATEAFQAISDAYFTLSDKSRRESYDRLRKSRPSSSWSSAPSSSSSFFEDGDSREERPDAEYVFGNVFEDLLRPEVDKVVPFWKWTGAAAGAVIGFIIGNVPGAAIGGYGGSRLGAVRDAKGKAVYEVFMGLAGDQKAAVLQALVTKVFGLSGIGAATR